MKRHNSKKKVSPTRKKKTNPRNRMSLPSVPKEFFGDKVKRNNLLWLLDTINFWNCNYGGAKYRDYINFEKKTVDARKVSDIFLYCGWDREKTFSNEDKGYRKHIHLFFDNNLYNLFKLNTTDGFKSISDYRNFLNFDRESVAGGNLQQREEKFNLKNLPNGKTFQFTLKKEGRNNFSRIRVDTNTLDEDLRQKLCWITSPKNIGILSRYFKDFVFNNKKTRVNTMLDLLEEEYDKYAKYFKKERNNLKKDTGGNYELLVSNTELDNELKQRVEDRLLESGEDKRFHKETQRLISKKIQEEIKDSEEKLSSSDKTKLEKRIRGQILGERRDKLEKIKQQLIEREKTRFQTETTKKINNLLDRIDKLKENFSISENYLQRKVRTGGVTVGIRENKSVYQEYVENKKNPRKLALSLYQSLNCKKEDSTYVKPEDKDCFATDPTVLELVNYWDELVADSAIVYDYDEKKDIFSYILTVLSGGNPNLDRYIRLYGDRDQNWFVNYKGGGLKGKYEKLDLTPLVDARGDLVKGKVDRFFKGDWEDYSTPP